MKYLYKDMEINYTNYGNAKGKTVVLLHGWGQNIEMMRPIGNAIDKDFNIYIIDLPGHGNSSMLNESLQIIDFVEILKSMFDDLKIKKPILIGHSFGGEVSLLYASKYDVEKIVVFDSPFRPIIKKLSLKTKILKLAKKIPGLNKLENFAKRHMGSEEYRSATPVMRETLVNSVNTDLTEDMKKIKAPTLILWGTKDDAVPLEDAYDLEKLIADSGIVEYEGCTHYAYLERLQQTINVLNNFLGGK